MSQLQSDFERWFGGSGRGSGSRPRRGSGKWLVVVAVVLALIAIASVGKGIYTEWLWFGTLGFQSVYTKILGTRVLLFVVAFLVFAALFAGNIILAARLSPRGKASDAAQPLLPFLKRVSKAAVIAVTTFFSLMFGSSGSVT